MDTQTRSTYWRQHQNDPTLWAHSAADLAYSARALFQRANDASEALIKDKPENSEPKMRYLLSEMGMYSVAFMLAGFALENLIKGLRVAQLNSESPVTEEDPRFKALTATHDLPRLAREAGIPTDHTVVEALWTLTEHIFWVGRYPRPKLFKNFMPDDPLNPNGVKLPMVSAGTWKDFEKLFVIINEMIIKENDDGKAA